MKKYMFAVLMIAALLITGCSQESYVAKVEKEKITQDEFKFYLDSVKQQMQGTEISSDDDWQTAEIEGKLAIDIAKERALETAIDNLAYIAIADKLNIKLSDEDEAKVKRVKDSIVRQYGGNAQYQEFLKQANLKDDFIEMLCRSMACNEKLALKVQEEQSVSDEDLKAYFDENQEELSVVYRKAKHVLRLTKDMNTQKPLSDEEIAEAERIARDVEKRAQAGGDFDALVAEYSEDPGSKSQPGGYVFTDGEMDPAFQDGVDNLQPGQIGLVESSFGYHVIQRLPLTFEDVKDKIRDQILSERLDAQIAKWKAELDIKIEKNEEVFSSLN